MAGNVCPAACLGETVARFRPDTCTVSGDALGTLARLVSVVDQQGQLLGASPPLTTHQKLLAARGTKLAQPPPLIDGWTP